MSDFANWVGILGVVLVLIAYFLLQSARLKSDDLSYSLLNLVGAILILYSLMFHWNLASVIIEIAWITISLIGIVRYIRTRPA